jgi:hypothetical protein
MHTKETELIWTLANGLLVLHAYYFFFTTDCDASNSSSCRPSMTRHHKKRSIMAHSSALAVLACALTLASCYVGQASVALFLASRGVWGVST